MGLKADTLAARAYLLAARAHLDSSRFEQAVAACRHGLACYEPHLETSPDKNLRRAYLGMRWVLAEALARSGNPRAGFKAVAASMRLARQHLPEEDPLLGTGHHTWGLLHLLNNTYDSAHFHLQRGLAIRQAALAEGHPDIGRSFLRLGVLQDIQGDFETSLTSLDRAADILIARLGEKNDEVAYCFMSKGTVYLQQGKLDQALEQYEKSLAIYLALHGETHLDVASLRANLGVLFYQMGAYLEAREYFEGALAFFSGQEGEGFLGRTGAMYTNIGSVLKELGAYEESLDYFERAIRVYRSRSGAEHPNLGHCYNNIGIVYDHLGRYRESIEQYRLAAALYARALGPEHPAIGSVYTNMGIAYAERRQLDSAMWYLRRSLAIKESTLGAQSPAVASSFLDMAPVVYDQGEKEEAFAFLRRGQELLEAAYGAKHPHVARCHTLRGDLYRRQGKNRQALLSYQQSLISNFHDFSAERWEINPDPLEAPFSPWQLLNSLQAKAQTLRDLWTEEPKDTALLGLAYRTYRAAVGLVETIRLDFFREKDRTTLVDKAYGIYEGQIETALDLHKRTGRDRFLRVAFSAFEQSRSLAVLSHLQAAKASEFVGLPPDLQREERKVRNRLAYLERSLYEENLKGAEANADQVAVLKDEILARQWTADSLSEVIRSRHPDYHRLVYDPSVPDLNVVQRRLPGPETALLEFFVGDREAYVFVVRSDSVALLSLGEAKDLNSLVVDLQAGAFGYPLSGTRSARAERAHADTLAMAAHTLYTRLIKPVLRQIDLPEQWIVIPDGILSYVPFELLLSSPPKDPLRWADHPYLLRDHRITYCYSATLLFEMEDRKGSSGGGLLAMAPRFPPVKRSDDGAIASRRGARAELGRLQYNQEEARAVRDLLGGRVLFGKDATKDAFLTEAPRARILHLATHGKADDRVGDYAYLAFAAADSARRADLLYNRELYNLNLSCDLVTLSACETGIGVLRRGEGVISLARGFHFAGAKSLLTTLWSVDDQRTAALMRAFYTKLRAGMAKDEALRQAKLDMLDRYGPDAAPFYWASFILVGDRAPLYTASPGLETWWALGSIALLAGAWLAWRTFSE